MLDLSNVQRLSTGELSRTIRSLEKNRELLQTQINTLHSILRRPVVRLPVEVLRTIFTYALPPACFLDPSLRAGGHNSSWCMTLRTKKALVLVCKLWRNTATNILYEEVMFRRPEQIVAFLRALDSSRLDLRTRVRRVGFLCAVPEESATSILDGLSEVLDRCDRVESLTWDPCYLEETPGDTRHISPARPLICPADLTHLECGESVNFEDLCAGLHHVCDTLRSLAFVLPVFARGIQRINTIPLLVDLDQLESLRVTYVVEPLRTHGALQFMISYWTMPCLKRLTVDTGPGFSKYDMQQSFWDVLTAFCGQHCERVEYLRVTARWDDERDLQPVLLACPVLKHLVINLGYTVPLAHPTLEWVDVEVPAARPQDTHACAAYYSALKDTGRLPRLRDVRLLDQALSALPDLPYVVRPWEGEEDCAFEWRFPGVHVCYRDERLFRADMACFDGLDGAFAGLYDRAHKVVKRKTFTQWDDDSPWVDNGSSSDDTEGSDDECLSADDEEC
ncbi:hypothetical protein PLICRDRAFT_170836 [Plicaturopsis crispa FD-325 SS-3]|nr:hypothetical protein PLICRDRAFT_170836 [Plicaturopsis crispa FD-325 SS-3]